MTRPIDNLAVGVVGLLGAEWWPSDQTLKHDGANAPPITAKVVSLSAEDLRRNVIRRAHGGICQLSSRFAPCVHLSAVRDGELDLVEGNAVAVLCQ